MSPLALPCAAADFLQAQPVVVLDGALATELERRGADLNDPLWSARLLIEQPGLIRQLHLDYFEAGADVATTASYQASFEGFARRGLDAATAAELMRTSVRLATEARDTFWAAAAHHPGSRRPLVAASVGPYGAMLADGSEYRGNYALDEAALMDFHRPRLQVLAAAGADLLAEEFPATPAWISFSCRDGQHNSQGERLADCAAALEGFEQVLAIGLNCTAPQHVDALIAELRAHTRKPVVVYPNSGEQYDAVHKRWLGCAHDQAFAEQAAGWARGGARLIGGCCRTSPANIRALRALASCPSAGCPQ